MSEGPVNSGPFAFVITGIDWARSCFVLKRATRERESMSDKPNGKATQSHTEPSGTPNETKPVSGTQPSPKPASDVPTNGKRLSLKEQAFVAEYMIDMNAQGAWKRLGFSNRLCTGNEMLKRPHVMAEVENRIRLRDQAISSVRNVTLDMLKAEYGRLAMAQAEGPLLYGHKLQAMDRLGNHLGMFKPEQVSVTPVQFVINGLGDANAIEQTVTVEPTTPNVLTVEKKAKGT